MSAPARSAIRLLAAFLAVSFALTTPALAALKRYEMRRRQLQHQASISPQAEFESRTPDKGIALLDQAGPSPVLRRQVWSIAGGTGLTVVVPQLSGGFAWFRGVSSSGPGSNQTGTGSSASTIAWGNQAGWTVSGGSFCHSVPSYLCSLVPPFTDNETVASPSFSTNYDTGSWIFHGSGFSQPDGRIFFTSPTNFGNSQYFDRGFPSPSGVVPALPLIGIGSVGLSVIALGIASVRRRPR